MEAESTDRNELQARDALLNHLRVPAGNIHAFPARRPGYSLASAAADFEQYLAAHWHGLDFALMGMGPDGHVASLFPDLANPDHPDLIVTEANSPKPPSQRWSFSYAGLREFGEVWFVIAGSDKANVTREVLMDSSCDLPAAILSRSIDSVWFIDESAAAGLR